jgi:hypothetical protein
MSGKIGAVDLLSSICLSFQEMQSDIFRQVLNNMLMHAGVFQSDMR